MRAYRPPADDADVLSVIEVSAIMLPMKVVDVPRVAELPICQKILHACAPLMSSTLELLAVVRVLPILNMKTLAELP